MTWCNGPSLTAYFNIYTDRVKVPCCSEKKARLEVLQISADVCHVYTFTRHQAKTLPVQSKTLNNPCWSWLQVWACIDGHEKHGKPPHNITQLESIGHSALSEVTSDTSVQDNMLNLCRKQKHVILWSTPDHISKWLLQWLLNPGKDCHDICSKGSYSVTAARFCLESVHAAWTVATSASALASWLLMASSVSLDSCNAMDPACFL